ncbi:MAG: hypothetical protein M3497_00575 [Gemmatimonadota bacterium]|nr:hypothetical protein [Gemmatimonadota bacterium]
MFCEVPDPLAGLGEVRRVVRRGGCLVLLEHVRPSGGLGVAAEVATALSRPLVGEHFNRNTENAVPQPSGRCKPRRHNCIAVAAFDPRLRCGSLCSLGTLNRKSAWQHQWIGAGTGRFPGAEP